MIPRQDVIAAFRLLLGRDPEEAAISGGMKLENVPKLVAVIADSVEFKKREGAGGPGGLAREIAQRHNSPTFSCPSDLAVTPANIDRVAFVGACFMESWIKPIRTAHSATKIDYFLFNNFARLPTLSVDQARNYRFQVIQVPLRSILPESTYLSLRYEDEPSFGKLLADAQVRLAQLLTFALAWNREHGMLTFVCNFMVPQQNPMGRLLPRADLRNICFLIRRLNDFLLESIGGLGNVFLLDVEEQAAIAGKRYIQDDSVCLTTHGGMLNDWDHAYDTERIHPPAPLSRNYDVRSGDFALQLFGELAAMYRTIRSVDKIKLVIVDLDDTLWRGVAAESGSSNIEGWPLGFIEALSFLKKRGVLLAVVSKNSEERIRAIWDEILGGRLRLSDFAAHRINWKSKPENIEAILRQTNVLPSSVLFIDDNPVEVAVVTAAFPEIRALGADPHYLKRILLWAAETQTTVITEESTRRTEMIQAQALRELERAQSSHEEFLKSLAVQIGISRVLSEEDKHFSRAFELVNKTNQFNTNGERWTAEMFRAHFADGGQIFTMDVQDRFTSYGLVGAVIVNGELLRQFVMSCRVFGLGVEVAAVVMICRSLIKAGHKVVRAILMETPANSQCRDVYHRCGFEKDGSVWHAEEKALAEVPDHIAARFAQEVSQPTVGR